MRFNILDFLLPRETKFFTLFDEHAQCVLDAAKRLRELCDNLESGSDAGRRDTLRTAVATIKEIERKADKSEAAINQALEESFITPLDREDIHMIAVFVDNTVDAIKALANKLETYGVYHMPPRSREFADIIVEGAQCLVEAFARVAKKANVTSQAKAISDAEHKADVLFSIAIGDLFNDGKDAIAVLKAKEIYEGLEDIVNRIDGTAKMLRRVMIKQG